MQGQGLMQPLLLEDWNAGHLAPQAERGSFQGGPGTCQLPSQRTMGL